MDRVDIYGIDPSLQFPLWSRIDFLDWKAVYSVATRPTTGLNVEITANLDYETDLGP